MSKGFYHCAVVCLYHRWMERRPDEIQDTDRTRMDTALQQLADYGARRHAAAKEARHPHVVYLLMDYHRVEDIVAEGRQAFTAAATA